GIYRRFPTLGGFDQMTARRGGVWDSLLGEGRRWWITATSDSHTNISEGGDDFWPGEYAKTFVMARPEAEDVLDGLRQGRVFVATGGLISELDVAASVGARRVGAGEALIVAEDEAVLVSIRVRDPAGANAGGRAPAVARIDLIVGDVSSAGSDRDADANPTTRVAHSFTAADWTAEGEVLTMTYRLPASAQARYLRVRGTNGAELEPAVDTPGEDPWSDLWFYSNPVFLERAPAAR
ncbi:MAG: phosphoesterase, partial [Brevundimonas sp.]